jgi:aminopeptidase N
MNHVGVTMSRSHFSRCVAEGGDEQGFLLPDARPHWLPARDVVLSKIFLDLDIHVEAKRVRGSAHLTFTAVKKGVESLFLDAREMRIETVIGENGAPLSFSQSDRGVLLRLAAPLERAGTGKVSLQYTVENPRLGLYFTGPDEHYPTKSWQVWSQGQDEDNKYWFPCVDHPREKVTSGLRVRVAKPYVAVSNGVLKERYEDQDGRLVYHWAMERPHSVYLISLAVGQYSELTDRFEDIPLSFFVPEGKEEDGWRSFEKTADCMRFFSERTGIRYPYPRYSQVVAQDFVFGGMENTTATTLTEMTLHDERAHLDFTSAHLVAHELAHQWFGDLVTSKSWSHSWLHEGFATYFDLLYTEYAEGRDEFRYRLLENRETYFEEHDSKYRRPIVTNVYTQPIDLFDMHLYPGSAARLHMLRMLLGEELWWEVIRRFLERHRDSVVETVDFMRCIEDVTGNSYDWFFDQWFYKPGFPVVECSYQYESKERVVAVQVKQVQDSGKDLPVFRFPLVVRLLSGNGAARDVTVEVREKEHHFYLRAAEEPYLVLVDPEDAILKRMSWKVDGVKLRVQLREAENVLKRIEAADELAKVGDREAVTALAQAIHQDPFWGVAARAARALGEIGTEAAKDALMGALAITHPKARRAAVKALGSFKDEAAFCALLPRAAQDPSYFVEAEAVLAAARTRTEGAFEVLKQALERDSFNEVVRCRALEGFGELEDDRALPVLFEYSRYGRHELIRAQALRSLGKMGQSRPRNREILEKIADTFRPPAGARTLRPKLAAVQALEMLNREEGLPVLRRVVESELDGRLVRSARVAMRKIEFGKDRGESIRKLEKRLDELAEENRKLKDRLDRLEKAGAG